MVSQRAEGSPERILRPRPVKAANPSILRTQEDDGLHLHVDATASGVSR